MNEQENSWCFEQGPIRPPNEAHSLLLRVTRNCPWNRCGFCPVYKGQRFSIRPVEHIKQDIDAVFACMKALKRATIVSGHLDRNSIALATAEVDPALRSAMDAAVRWKLGGTRTVFLQDANSMITKAADLVEILQHLRQKFPQIERITCYARSQTLDAKTSADLQAIANAGLNRVHIGMESGSDKVLEMVQKGVTRAQHIEGARKAKDAGIEISEYVMPGLGGKDLSAEHAAETADALNQINPRFIRLRTLAIPKMVPLAKMVSAGQFKKMTDLEIVKEMDFFLQRLDCPGATIASDHVLNLFEDLEGKLPEDKPRLLSMLNDFLSLDAQSQTIYQVGRRVGIYRSIKDLSSDAKREIVEKTCRDYQITPENVDTILGVIMQNFI